MVKGCRRGNDTKAPVCLVGRGESETEEKAAPVVLEVYEPEESELVGYSRIEVIVVKEIRIVGLKDVLVAVHVAQVHIIGLSAAVFGGLRSAEHRSADREVAGFVVVRVSAASAAVFVNLD